MAFDMIFFFSQVANRNAKLFGSAEETEGYTIVS